MNTQIWLVKFGNWTTTRVLARNPKDAINRAISQRKRHQDTYQNRLQDVTDVQLLETCDYE